MNTQKQSPTLIKSGNGKLPIKIIIAAARCHGVNPIGLGNVNMSGGLCILLDMFRPRPLLLVFRKSVLFFDKCEL